MLDRLRMRTLERELEPENAYELTAFEARKEVPEKPGVYAAWVTDARSLREVGIAGPTPQLLYIGKAPGKRGLRERLETHSHTVFFDLQTLLALRGNVLFNWWGRLASENKERIGRYFKPSKLGELSDDQTRVWQHQHVMWAWSLCPADYVASVERDLIVKRTPLLNRQHGGPELPELRRMGRYDAARARWLWHMSWAALLVGDLKKLGSQARQWEAARASSRYGSDSLGYPVASDGAAVKQRRITALDFESREALMADAIADAPPEVRHAFAQEWEDVLEHETEIWWAAHRAAELLPTPISVRDAMSATLSLATDSEAPGPKRLPSSSARMTRLLHLTKALRHMRH
jgi:hypothetical protein